MSQSESASETDSISVNDIRINNRFIKENMSNGERRVGKANLFVFAVFGSVADNNPQRR